MKKYIMIGLSILFIASMGLITLSKEKNPAFIEMEVKGVRIDPIGQSPVVILADRDEKKALPIWIGLLEANAINKELNQTPSSRPMTHDLLHSILAQTQVKVKEVKIVDLKEQTYYATLFLTLNKGQIEVDARPSDAIILALKSKVPILVSVKILDQQGLALSMKEGFGERHGIRIQKLTPSLASQFNFKGQKGVLVSEVLPESISEASGIKAGDIITKINLKEVGSVQEFEEIFDTLKAGSTIRILFFRDKKFQEANLSLKP
jgi:bifunctional DNase/RNase